MANRARPDAFVTYLEGYGPFVRLWVQPDRFEAARLEGRLAEAAARLDAAPAPSRLQPGQLLAARRRAAWYRVRLLAAPDPPRPALLRFLDFGHCDSAAPADLRPPDADELWAVPPQAAPLLLARAVHPAGRWEEPVLEYLRRAVYGREVRPRVEMQCGEHVFVGLAVDGSDFADHLIRNDVAVAVSLDLQAAQLKRTQGAPLGAPASPPTPPPKAAAQPGLARPRPLNRAGQKAVSEIRGARAPGSGPPTYRPRLLDVDSEHRVSVTHVEDGPRDFAVRLRSEDAALASLGEAAARLADRAGSPSPISVGTVCLGTFADGTTRRAAVVRVTNDRCELYSVDCGSTEWVSCEDVHRIPEELIAPNVLAFKFCLAGAPAVVDDRARRAFAALVDGETLTLRVVRPTAPSLVQSCELFSAGRRVADLLAATGPPAFERVDASRLRDGARVAVSSVDSCSKFFVRPLESDDALAETMARVAAHCSRASPMPYPEMRPGAACCAFYPEDEKWYRAQILNVRRDVVTVEYVDYGNDTEVSFERVKPIDEALRRLPAQAIRCALSGYEGRSFDREAADRLEALTIENELRMKVCGLLDRDRLVVKLFDESLDPPDLAEHLAAPPTVSQESPGRDESARNGNGVPCDDAPRRDFASEVDDRKKGDEVPPNESRRSDSRKSCPRSKNYDENKSVRRTEAAARNAKERNPTNPQQRKKNFESQNDDQNFSKPSNRSRYSENKTNPRPREHNNNPSKLDQRLIKARALDTPTEFAHHEENFNPVTHSNYNDNRQVNRSNSKEHLKQDARPFRIDLRTYSRPERPVKDEHSNYREKRERPPATPPKALNNPAPFDTSYSTFSIMSSSTHKIKIPWFINPNDFYVQIISSMDEFNKMMNRLPDMYSGIRPYSGYIANGSSVIVQNPDDDVLYRAQIIENNGGEYVVHYVDFGNRNIVSAKKLWQVECELFALPKMAIKCSLADIKPADGKWSTNNREDHYFNSDSYDCTFLAYKSDTHSVSLVDGNGSGVDDMLVNNNLAVNFNKKQKGDVIDYDYLVGQKFYSQILKIEHLSKFHLCFEPLNRDVSKISTKSSTVPVSNEAVECSIYNLNNLICTISDSEFIAKFENKHVIAYVNKVTNTVQVTLYDVISGKKLEYFKDHDNTLVDGESGICPHPVFNKNFGPSFVSHVESINVIYIQRSKNSDDLASFLNELFQFYESEDAEAIASPKIGDTCVAKSFDLNWYRARITNVLSDACEVLYIDYGNRENVPNNNLKIFNAQFNKYPEFALRCEIENITTESGVTHAKLNEVLLDKEFNVKIDRGSLPSPKWTPTMIIENVDVIDDLIGKSVPPEFIIVKNNAPIENNSDMLTVFVSHIDSPGQFWLQLASENKNLNSLNEKLTNVESFDDLLEYEIGTQCIAKYSACDMFYRAVILDCDNDIITVRFTDYGNTDVLSNVPGALKKIPGDWPTIEPLSIKCSVNASPTGMGEWTEQATELFTESTGDTDSPVQAKIILRGATTYVDLYNDSVNITDVLVKAGHAAPAEKLTSAAPLKCYASHVNSISEFWIQLDSSVIDLEKVSDQLLEAESFSPLVEAEEGVVCVAKFSEDDLWYRAKIVVKVSDGTEVLFMDYGNASLTTELRCLPDSLKTLPALSRKCSLQKPGTVDTWSKAAEKRFVELAADGANPFQVVFNASGDISVVDLLIDGKSIAEELSALSDVKSTPDAEFIPIKISENYGPTNFWIQYADKADGLTKLEDNLKSLDSHDELLKSEEITQDMLCLSMENDLMFRSRVLEKNETSVKIIRVDYGTITEAASLRKITPELQNVPMFAKKCSLTKENIISIDKNNFIKRVDKLSQYYVKVLNSDVSPVVVELFTKNDDVYNNILEALNESNPDENTESEDNVSTDEQDEKSSDDVVNEIDRELILDVSKSTVPSDNSVVESDMLEKSDVNADSDVEENLKSASDHNNDESCNDSSDVDSNDKIINDVSTGEIKNAEPEINDSGCDVESKFADCVQNETDNGDVTNDYVDAKENSSEYFETSNDEIADDKKTEVELKGASAANDSAPAKKGDDASVHIESESSEK